MPAASAIPDRLVVLTFDDAVASHRAYVAPLLSSLGFSATFFVTHGFMHDREHFMNWDEIAEIHEMGFEIGNHSWSHAEFESPRGAARLAGELALVERELAKVGVPRPLSFGFTGNFFGPEAVDVLRDVGMRFARRGEMPEQEYGKAVVGPVYDPTKHHRLLIPTTGDAYPNWTFDHFRDVVSRARDGKIVVLQFHGVPDVAHPWVDTPPDQFREYMVWLHEHGFRTLAMRDLAEFVNPTSEVPDPMLDERYPAPAAGEPLPLPVEVEQTQAALRPWLDNMLSWHRYDTVEAAAVCGISVADVQNRADEWRLPASPSPSGLRVLPYPGGRHPRTGFLEGAIEPLRGTKASIFLPWDDAGYVVLDVPEAIFVGSTLLFLAHTHEPTVWNDRNHIVENVDWECDAAGVMRSEWVLPDGVSFGASLEPDGDQVRAHLWLTNSSPVPLAGLRAQVCLLLKGAPGFEQRFDEDIESQRCRASVQHGANVISIEWDECWRTWANPACPCVHADPVLPDCLPGQTVRVDGRLSFETHRLY
jgi:peptidoglycan/xylan/chitin deacetylase (PgdA/CDA1 family)